MFSSVYVLFILLVPFHPGWDAAPTQHTQLRLQEFVHRGAGNRSLPLHERHRGIFNTYQLMLADGTPSLMSIRGTAHVDASPCLPSISVIVYIWVRIQTQPRQLRADKY